MEEDDICLPADTLKILNEFLLEKAQREHDEYENIQNKKGTNACFEEDWQLSQFWYNDFTKKKLSRVVWKLNNLKSNCSEPDLNCALLSCPSLYASVKDIHSNVKIFEYDKRFEVYAEDFVFYDFNEAKTPQYLKEYWQTFDVIIVDPPFLSEECISKMCEIVKNIQKPQAKIIFCSGDVVEKWVIDRLKLNKCKFRPQHQRNLGNEFVSYANFDLDYFISD